MSSLYLFVKNSSGAASLESGLIVCLIGLGIVVGSANIGDRITQTFDRVAITPIVAVRNDGTEATVCNGLNRQMWWPCRPQRSGW